MIFDCDGVLVDSDRLSLRLQAEEVTKLGWALSFEECMREFMGIGVPATIERIEQHLGRAVPDGWEQALAARVDQVFAMQLRPVAGVVEMLDALDVATCVASSGSHDKIRRTLGLTGLLDRFDGRIFSATEVGAAKPAPDLFLYSARSLGVPPERCVVVEDSPAGVQAARAAGILAYAYAALTPREWLAGPATILLDDMRDLPRLLRQR